MDSSYPPLSEKELLVYLRLRLQSKIGEFNTDDTRDALDLIEYLAVKADLFKTEYNRSQAQLNKLLGVKEALKYLAKQIDEID